MGTSRHFTYHLPLDDENLHQGDVISRTNEVNALIKEVHPHFDDPVKYPFFLVLTQTCDLVKRDNKSCKARYISLAVVRPLTDVLNRIVQDKQYKPFQIENGIISIESIEKVKQQLARIINNNEPEYFYIYRQPSSGIVEDQSAFLKVSIAIRADLHYDSLLLAKVLQWKEAFEHKLGYLVGTSYSRIGTEDWPEKDLAEKIDQYIKDANVLPLEKKILKPLEKKFKNLQPTQQAILDEITDLKRTESEAKSKRIIDALNLVSDEFSQHGVEQSIGKKVKRKLEVDPQFTALIRK